MATVLAQAHFLASGSWTVPTGVTFIRYFIVGGGSSGVPCGANGYPGPGGNGGHVVRGIKAVAAGDSVTITIGAGGAQVNTAGNPSLAGTASSIAHSGTTITAPGGEGGAGADPATATVGSAEQTGPTANGETVGGMGGFAGASGSATGTEGGAGSPGIDGYAGGGGGGSASDRYHCAPGSHGGGRGGMGPNAGANFGFATAGRPNTGGGGGGGGGTTTGTAGYGRAGGSGYVRFEYAVVT